MVEETGAPGENRARPNQKSIINTVYHMLLA